LGNADLGYHGSKVFLPRTLIY